MTARRLDVEVTCDERAPATARSLLDELLEGLPADARFSVRLMTSELVANVVRHAGLGPGDVLRLRCEVADGRVRCEVEDRGLGVDAARRATDGLGAGLGLSIVRTLSSSSGLESGGGATRAWFELQLADATPAAAGDGAQPADAPHPSTADR